MKIFNPHGPRSWWLPYVRHTFLGSWLASNVFNVGGRICFFIERVWCFAAAKSTWLLCPKLLKTSSSSQQFCSTRLKTWKNRVVQCTQRNVTLSSIKPFWGQSHDYLCGITKMQAMLLITKAGLKWLSRNCIIHSSSSLELLQRPSTTF
jgi:hypothetical protein